MKQRFNKFLSVFLSFVMVIGIIGSIPVTASAEGNSNSGFSTMTLISSEESTLAPGVTQYENSVYAADGKLINYCYAVADLSNEYVGIHTSYKDAQCTTGGMAKMTAQAASLEALHSNQNDADNYIENYAVVAGVNGDGYDTGSGYPSGIHVANWVYGFNKTAPGTSKDPWFGLFADGTALCGSTLAEWNAAIEAHGQPKEAIGGFQLVMKDGVEIAYGTTAAGSSYLDSGRYPRSFIGVTVDNKVVMMAVDGNGAGGSAGSNYAESVEILKQAGCTDILCLDGGGSATYISRPEGSDAVQVTSNPSDGSERAVSNGIVIYSTVPASDVFEKAVLTPEHTYVTPGSEVKVSAVGVSPAGTAADIPENAVYTSTNGTVSAEGVFTSDGTVGDAVICLTVDGAVVGTTTIHVVYPDSIAFDRDSMTVPYGKTIDLEIDAKYGVNKVVVNDDDIIFTVEGENCGSIKGWSFTAPESGSETTVTAKVNGSEVEVSDTIVIKFGKSSETVFDFETGTVGADINNWRVSNHGGYTVADISIVNEKTGKVHSGDSAMAFHYPIDEAMHGTHSFWSGNSLVWTGDPVELKNATSLGFWIYVPEDAVQFSIYASVTAHDEDGNFLRKNSSSEEIYDEDYINNLEYSGWRYFKIPISDDVVYIEDNTDAVSAGKIKSKANCLIEFYAVNISSWEKDETNFAGDFTFYIDDITVDYSEAVEDREAPVFSSMTYAVEGMSDAAALDGQTVTEKKVSLAGIVEDDMTNANNATGIDSPTAVTYVDGVKTDCEYSDGMITSEVELTDGVHTIRMGIFDKAGNYSEIERQITVKSDDTDNSVRVRPQDSTLNYILNDAVYWVDVEADAIETVKSIEMKLDLDSMNNWELDHIETLYGFDCEYSFATAAEKAENILTITFTRNAEYLSERGTQVIASIPIRVWNYKTSDDHTHADAKAAWDCKYGCGPALSIDVDTERGVVTYLDDTSHTFSSEDIHTLCVSYACVQYIRDYDTDFYNANSYHVHTVVAMDDVEVSCTENGYTGRTYCETCASVVDWGTTIPAKGHTFAVVDGVLKCECGELYNGVYEDGETYVDGVALAGWVDDRYYVDGVMLTGVQLVDGYYYDFGEDGVCENQTKITGFFYDPAVSAYRYAIAGELQSGWVDNYHYIIPETKVAATGEYYYAARDITYLFDEMGKTEGVWQETSAGTRYWYGKWYYTARNANQRYFVDIDGKTYNFDTDGYLTPGIRALYDDWASTMRGEMNVWEFDENGALVKQITGVGVVGSKESRMYLIEEDGFVHGGDEHLAQYDGNYYYVYHSGKLALNTTINVSEENSNGLPTGTYEFDDEGKGICLSSFTGVKEGEDGILYYYKEGKLGNGIYNSELVEIDGAIYLVKWSGKVAANETREVTAEKSNGMTPGTYEFAADGKGTCLANLTGVKEGTDGILYYYKDGKLGNGIYNSELVEIDGAIYLVKWSGKVAANETREVTAEKSNGLATGTYEFAADGKGTCLSNFTGVKEGTDGILYYYKDGKLGNGIYNSELVEIDGAIYLVKWSGKVAANETREITTEKSNGMTPGTYEFAADGKGTCLANFTGVKEGTDGILYYYKDGKLGNRLYNSELVEIDGAIYLVKWSGKVAANETREITSAKSNGLVDAGTYTFGSDGKLIVN